MRNERHIKRSVIVVGGLIMSVALPVTVLLSREQHGAAPAASRGVELAASIPAASIAASTIPQDIDIPTSYDGATQSVSMVLVGSLLIGIGSVIRRSV
jgi:hypothetical protein